MSADTSDLHALKYPIGRFAAPDQIDKATRAVWIGQLASLATDLRVAVASLSDAQLDTPYRPGGWSVRQLVHHLADSHLNSYTRFRLALTEDSPVIKPYEEKMWAELPDAKSAAVNISLNLIDSLHARWVLLLNAMSNDDFTRTFRHPESGEQRLDRTLGLYAWHCRHHLAHIHRLREREGW